MKWLVASLLIVGAFVYGFYLGDKTRTEEVLAHPDEWADLSLYEIEKHRYGDDDCNAVLAFRGQLKYAEVRHRTDKGTTVLHVGGHQHIGTLKPGEGVALNCFKDGAP